jgi:hypothetical protein
MVVGISTDEAYWPRGSCPGANSHMWSGCGTVRPQLVRLNQPGAMPLPLAHRRLTVLRVKSTISWKPPEGPQ